MDINEIYETYSSEKFYVTTYKNHFQDKMGFLNEFAFNDFVHELIKNENLPDYYLTCINVDLRIANSESMATGDYVLRKVIISLEDYYVFRIQGEKFNILCEKSQIEGLKEILNKPYERCKIYYGIVDDVPFKPKDDAEERALIRKGIRLMYANKGEKSINVSDSIVANKGNTPKQYQETKLKKYCNTMWYSIIKLQITEPIYKEVNVYVFPTTWKEAMRALPIIVAVYDNVSYNVKCCMGEENSVQFGIEGLRFNVSCRFDRDNHLAVTLFAVDKCKWNMENHTTHEGDYIPASFGKRLSPTKELYPIRKNIKGVWDYVLYEDGNIILNTEGYVTTPNGSRYGVFMDDKCLDLIQV